MSNHNQSTAYAVKNTLTTNELSSKNFLFWLGEFIGALLVFALPFILLLLASILGE